jgi:uncharacterized protein (TIGR03083 family)
MQQPGRDQFFAEIRASAARLADIASGSDPDLPVPSCPDWTLRQLATHVGRVHRWAAEIVGSRAAERIPFDAAPDGRYPAAAPDRAAWLNAGADRVIAAITAAGDQPVWAFGRLAPASFWARRQSHETMVHRADAELAVGADVVLDAGLAVDGIDEWLASVTDPRYRQRGDGSGALPVGSALAVRATGAGSAGEWLISSTAAGLRVERSTGSQPGAHSEHGTGGADATVSGPADRLLLVLVRRLPADDPAVTVTGDGALLTGWLAGTPF